MSEKLRVLLDTNVYEYFLKEEHFNFLKEVEKSERIIIYGNKLIRGELRDTPRWLKIKSRSTRALLLEAFDRLVRKHLLPVTDLTHLLAVEYYKEYSGIRSIKKAFF